MFEEGSWGTLWYACSEDYEGILILSKRALGIEFGKTITVSGLYLCHIKFEERPGSPKHGPLQGHVRQAKPIAPNSRRSQPKNPLKP